MTSAGFSRGQGSRSALTLLEQPLEEDGTPISLSAIWLVPGVLVGLVVVVLLLMVKGK